jgi:hypothetical protein
MTKKKLRPPMKKRSNTPFQAGRTLFGGFGPPQRNLAVTYNQTFRFKAVAAASNVVRFSALQFAVGCAGAHTGGSGTGTLTALCDAIKINSVEVWSPPTAGASVEVVWQSIPQFFTRPTYHQDICQSSTEPAHIKCRPPSLELYRDWISASSGYADFVVMEIINSNAETIIDINLSAQMWFNQGNSQETLTAASSITAGVLYFGYLDGINGPGNLAGILVNSTY